MKSFNFSNRSTDNIAKCYLILQECLTNFLAKKQVCSISVAIKPQKQ